MILLPCTSCNYVNAPYYDTPKSAWIHSQDDFEEPDRKILKEIDTIFLNDIVLYVFIDNFDEVAVSNTYVKKEGTDNTYFSVGGTFFDKSSLSYTFESDSFSTVKNQKKVIYNMRLKNDSIILVNGRKAETKVYQIELQGEMYDVELWYAHLERDEDVKVSLKA